MADNWFKRFLSAFYRVYPRPNDLAVTAQVDDSPGWSAFGAQPHDRDISEVQALYADALTAWRKNPIAWRIISITTDYIVGDRIQITSTNRRLARFASNFWNHPKNHMDLRLETMSDELARSGDLFAVLFRNPADGMSYLRFVTKDRITRIECAANDWENELAFYEVQDTGEPKKWLSPTNPAAADSPAVMMHYAVNRPLGALLGESDLATMLPWLQRYSRMLEDRVRLHWAIRAFLWIVTVPTNQVQSKKEEYRNPPEAGSIIVKDEAETWDVFNPSLQGADASHDMKAVRGMIDSGSGYPPHWRGEAADANLATATAMQAPTERHLLRRQQYFTFVLEDLIYQAYQRAIQAGSAKPLPTNDYDRLFVVQVPDVSRSDNEALARAAKDIAGALTSIAAQPRSTSTTLQKLILRLAFRFAGEPQTDQTLDQIVEELAQAPQEPAAPPATRTNQTRRSTCQTNPPT